MEITMKSRLLIAIGLVALVGACSHSPYWGASAYNDSSYNAGSYGRNGSDRAYFNGRYESDGYNRIYYNGTSE
jgi:hypothetical protein